MTYVVVTTMATTAGGATMTGAEEMTTGGRLKQALERSGKTKSGFLKEIQERLGKDTREGVSWPALSRYLNDETNPSVAFLKAAADIVGVRAAWLIVEDGEPTTEQQTARQQERQTHAWFLRAIEASRKQEAHLIRYELDLGDPPLMDDRAAALVRFAHRLDDSYHADSPWATPNARKLLLEEVGRLLVGIDELYIRRNKPLRGDEPERPHSGSFAELRELDKAALVARYDKLLDAIADSVKGLGTPRGIGIPTAPALRIEKVEVSWPDEGGEQAD
jgi:transcriptional regulator with XRE-family HTH domain